MRNYLYLTVALLLSAITGNAYALSPGFSYAGGVSLAFDSAVYTSEAKATITIASSGIETGSNGDITIVGVDSNNVVVVSKTVQCRWITQTTMYMPHNAGTYLFHAEYMGRQYSDPNNHKYILKKTTPAISIAIVQFNGIWKVFYAQANTPMFDDGTFESNGTGVPQLYQWQAGTPAVADPVLIGINESPRVRVQFHATNAGVILPNTSAVGTITVTVSFGGYSSTKEVTTTFVTDELYDKVTSGVIDLDPLLSQQPGATKMQVTSITTSCSLPSGAIGSTSGNKLYVRGKFGSTYPTEKRLNFVIGATSGTDVTSGPNQDSAANAIWSAIYYHNSQNQQTLPLPNPICTPGIYWSLLDGKSYTNDPDHLVTSIQLFNEALAVAGLIPDTDLTGSDSLGYPFLAIQFYRDLDATRANNWTGYDYFPKVP